MLVCRDEDAVGREVASCSFPSNVQHVRRQSPGHDHVPGELDFALARAYVPSLLLTSPARVLRLAGTSPPPDGRQANKQGGQSSAS